MLHSFVNFNPAYTTFTFTSTYCSVCLGVNVCFGERILRQL